MDIKLAGLTLSQWQKIKIDIVSMDSHNKVYGALTAEGKKELHEYVQVMIQMGVEDERFADSYFGATQQELSELAGKSYDEILLSNAPLVWAQLTGYVVGQVDECELQMWNAANSHDTAEDIVIYGCPYCFWHPVGHKRI